ncbi:hypothetical protein LOTGIDRAFT_159014 [Lottia gigantea]|uniref:G-protein coupled receptors family 1 profile domain-containing protein n=1 Tax=Lottia gigantea TaxID=225164 RepID=V4C8Z3_LOTGI|nr:hypothetical protein LOTGIDRAFT_159014 [Lottia gigantea]ESO98224.1 hypothetical protein LOTGIDRAFT_159014 [Lottia gigantea]
MKNCTLEIEFMGFEDQSLFYTVVNLFLCVFICSGNILTIAVVWRTPVLRTVPNMYVVSLAVADLLVGGLAVPIQALFYIPVVRKFDSEDEYFCLFRHVSFFVSALASILHIVAIAVDRTIYIGYPLHYPLISTGKRALVLITSVWIFSLITGSIPMYYNHWGPCRPCYVFWLIPRPYMICVGVLFLIASVITACLYGYILNISRTQRKSCGEVVHDKRRFESEMKLVRSFMIIFGLFFISWLPLLVVTVVGPVDKNSSLWLSRTIPFGIANSGVNFIIYVWKNTDFRQAIIRMVCSKKYAQRRIQPQQISVVASFSRVARSITIDQIDKKNGTIT